MKLGIVMSTLFSAGTILFGATQLSSENHTDTIVTSILETKQKIIDRDKNSEYHFLAFWDFDGTILKGDCSEGYSHDGKQLYKGLAELAIENGYSQLYKGEDGVKKFFTDYRYMEHNVSRWLAYPFIPQMLTGSNETDIRKMSYNHFKQNLESYYFASSLKILSDLEKNGVDCHIISASSNLFVDAAADGLGLPVDRFNGIELFSDQGKVTERLRYPVTWNKGKTEKLLDIVDAVQKEHPFRKVIVLAGFGNSYNTDGPFLKHIATSKLPGGSPLAVMINGGETPDEYKGLFTTVNQEKTVSGN